MRKIPFTSAVRYRTCGKVQKNEIFFSPYLTEEQTISKWETDETLPDIRQSKKLAVLYGLTLDELIDFDADVKELEQMVRNTSEEIQQKVDWTKLWAEKYPVLSSYKQEVKTEEYAGKLEELLRKLKQDYGYNELDSFLVLKDILAGLWTIKQ